MIKPKHQVFNYKRAAAFITASAIVACAVCFVFWGEIRAYRYRNYSEVRIVDGSDWFNYPVGAPNAKGYYRAQRFGEENQHLGEDWNGMGGGNSDYGDLVYAISDGKVIFAEDVSLGWGNVVRIIHPVDAEQSVEAVYAHLADIRVHKGDKVKSGQVVGSIGDAGGAYLAHLHFEIRAKPGLKLGGGYGYNRDGEFLDPSDFIDRHRKHPRN